MRRCLLVVIAACGGTDEPSMMMEAPPFEEPTPPPSHTPVDTRTVDVVDAARFDDGPSGFIGSACANADDCKYADAVCLTDGPRGICSAPCDRFCPDLDGHPVTFCIDPGRCASQCDFGLFPTTGCRTGYGCVEEARFNEPGVSRLVCRPGETTDPLSDCHEELAELGVSFSPTVIADRSPASHPNLTCHVEDPVRLHPPIRGLDLQYFDGSPSPNLPMSCSLALSIAKTADDLVPLGVERLLHLGTYNCRVISDTDRLSRHAFGDAIDIYGFEFTDGRRYTLIDDWEHDTMMPTTEPGAFLYEAAYRWHDAKLYTIILTPNYNVAHDNHFHVDLTPGSDFIQLLGDEGYVGPAPYAD